MSRIGQFSLEVRRLGGRVRRWRDRRTILSSGVFDRLWYLTRYPDVAAAGRGPILHYLDDGRRAYYANSIFDSDWYLARYGGDIANPLLDYLRGWARHGRDPNQWFDQGWYRRTYLADRPHDEPMRHYLEEGASSGNQPSEAFAALDRDTLRIAETYPDLGRETTPLGFFLQAYRMTGAIGDCTSFYVNGFAARREGPQLVVTVCVNGVEQGTIVPWIPRPDVFDVLGVVGVGFVFLFPTRLRCGDLVELRDEFGQTLVECRRVYQIPPLGTDGGFYGTRAAIAASFLHGKGVEIGAFSQPLDLPPDRDVAFFDRHEVDVMRRSYDRMCGRPLMAPTYVGDAQTLDALPDATFDFLVANHVIEHLQDPIAFLQASAAKLAPNGRAFIAAPDKRATFDRNRDLTDFAHLVDDHENGPQHSQFAHFMEWSINAVGLTGDEAMAHALAFDARTLLFHYHVWTAETFVAFVEEAIAYAGLPLRLIYSQATPNEIIVILEKIDA